MAWFAKLKDDDTIITFNYDTAVERIAKMAGKPFPAMPGSYQSGQPQLIKLHGSADWHKDGAVIKQMDRAFLDDVEIAIGMPGNGKSKLTENALFETLWTSARRAIEEAGFISIIGYSMPETDNNARMMILDSVAKGRDTIRRLNLVLGPDMGAIRAKRMMSILQPLLGGRKGRVTDVSMFTQDYLPRVADYLTYDF